MACDVVARAYMKVGIADYTQHYFTCTQNSHRILVHSH